MMETDLNSVGCRPTTEATPTSSRGAGGPHFPLRPDHDEIRPADGDCLEQHAFRYGRSYDAYLVTEPGWECFRPRRGRGAVGLVRKGRYLFSSGGLLAPDDHKENLLTELIDYAAANRFVLTLFNVVEEDLPLLRKFGFQATKWGEEALVDLPSCSWAGRDYEWVRRQSNFCKRHGLVVTECKRECTSASRWEALIAELSEVSGLFLAGKPQAGEIRFLQGSFDPRRLERRRIFVARSNNGAGRVEGFLACNPCAGGTIWTMETYRQRPDTVRGTNPFLIHQTMRLLQSEGVEQVSLCLIPGLRCRQKLPGDSALVRWGMVVGTERFSLIFDTAGAYHFKTRFRPRFENRYLCTRPKFTPGAAWAFIRLLGVLRLDPWKLGREIARRWRVRASRATLRTPEEA